MVIIYVDSSLFYNEECKENMKKKIVDFVREFTGIKAIKNQISSLRRDLLFENRKNQMIEHILHDSESGITSEKYADHDIIVSLTSYGKRIYDVAYTIESIMQQSMKANKVILWLDDSYKGKMLPQSLVKQQKRGLEIAFCTDLGPYKKLVPSLCRFPNDAIITVDDDAIYDYDLLERLIIPYLEDPSYIYCHRCHRMQFSEDGSILPYMQWMQNFNSNTPSHFNFATGVGGVLYPPRSLDEEVKNEKVFMDICKYNDDIWFKAMAIKKGTKVKKVFTRNPSCKEYVLNDKVQDIGLFNINTKGDMLNDKQIHDVFLAYKIAITE
jgi:hypothetical protein